MTASLSHFTTSLLSLSSFHLHNSKTPPLASPFLPSSSRAFPPTPPHHHLLLVHNDVRCHASSAATPDQLATTNAATALTPDEVDVETILQHVQRHGCCIPTAPPSSSTPLSLTTTIITGTGLQLGIDVQWELRIRSDGAFREHVTSPHLSMTSGYDGGVDGAAWDVDNSGICHQLQLDDNESAILNFWVRTGVWALPQLRSRLKIEFVHPEEEEGGGGGAFFNDGDDDDSTTTKMVVLRVSLLHSGSVTALIGIDPHTWRPVKADVSMCWDKERWSFENWREWAIKDDDGNGVVPLPEMFLHESMNGGNQYLNVFSVAVTVKDISIDNDNSLQPPPPPSSSHSSSSTSMYTMPEHVVFPNDAVFLKGIPTAVPVWHTKSGHLLARASINGHPDTLGFFIIDTGASGFVVEPSVADALQLEAFGEVHVTGVAGKVKGKFRKAKSFQIGSLQMKDVVMMEMTCSGLCATGPSPIIGIVGFDVFRRAVVDIPAMVVPPSVEEEEEERDLLSSPAAALALSLYRKPKRPPSFSSNASSTPYAYINIHHPEEADDVLRLLRPEDWLPVTMLSMLPHIPVTMHADKTTPGRHHSALIMVDTGAGGMGALLNANAGAALGLFEHREGRSQDIRGIGGSAASPMTLTASQLRSVKVGQAVEFEQVQVLVAKEKAVGGVLLSRESAGILCGGVLSRCRLVLDWPRGRMAILSAEIGGKNNNKLVSKL